MSYRFLLLVCFLVLGACAYATEKSIQDLTVVTPGAHDALCYVEVDGMKYKFHPPETVNIFKSKKDLIVDCLAPGNRHQRVIIEPQISTASIAGNIPTGLVPGAAWDYTSGAMFKYPDIVEVNFTHTPVKSEDLPAHNNPDIKQPEEYFLEEFSPGEPRLNSDRYEQPVELKRREKPAPGGGVLTSGYMANDTAAAPAMSKGELMNVIQDMGDEMNPAGSGVSEGQQGSDPVPLFPGQ